MHRNADRPGSRNAGRIRRRRQSAEHLQPLPRRSRVISRTTSSAIATSTPASVKAFAQQQLDAERARRRATACPARRTSARRCRRRAPRRSPPERGAESVNADEAWRKEQPKRGASASRSQLPTPTSFQLRERPDGAPQRAPGLADRLGEPRREDRQRRESRRQARTRELHRRDARRGHGHAHRRCRLPTKSRSSAASLDDRVHDGLDAGDGGVAAPELSGAARDLLADVARHPSFPAEEVERQRASRLASLVQQRENPDAVAVDGDGRRAVRSAHPYGYHRARHGAVEQGDDARRPAEVLDAELRAEQRRARRVGTDHRRRSAAAGREGVRRLAAGHAGAAGARRARRRRRRGVVLVDKPGAPQTQLRVAIDRRCRARRPTTRRCA